MNTVDASSTVRCYNCQYENPEGAKFCQNCGAPQTIPCHNCGTALRPTARFCFNCGAPQLAVGAAVEARDAKREQVGAEMTSGPLPAPPSELEKIQQYIPEE